MCHTVLPYCIKKCCFEICVRDSVKDAGEQKVNSGNLQSASPCQGSISHGDPQSCVRLWDATAAAVPGMSPGWVYKRSQDSKDWHVQGTGPHSMASETGMHPSSCFWAFFQFLRRNKSAPVTGTCLSELLVFCLCHFIFLQHFQVRGGQGDSCELVSGMASREKW